MDAMRSAIFSEYNKARRALSDPERTDRALGLLLSGEAERKWFEYDTTVSFCACMDEMARGRICKHRRAFMIDYRTHFPRNGVCHHVSLRADWDDRFNPIKICNDCGKIFRKENNHD